MNIGEKIKKIRTAKLMSQRELAGSEITRNMLSRIENGAALPSMGTIHYIAQRLNVSPGFLLAGEDDELLYFKSSEMSNIKKAYADKNFRLCREMCINSEWEDDELLLILAECCARVGAEEFSKGYLRTAADRFDEALEYCERTLYNTEMIACEIYSYFSYMRMLSPTLSSNVADDERVCEVLALSDSFCVYSTLFCNFEDGDPHSVLMKKYLPEDSSYALHIEVKELIECEKYAEAKVLLHKLLFDDAYELPEPMLYFIFCDLEICCKETGDFKGAYEYSGNKIALLQKLLA